MTQLLLCPVLRSVKAFVRVLVEESDEMEAQAFDSCLFFLDGSELRQLLQK